MKPKIAVNFNELIDDNQVLLSQTDVIKDVFGNEVLLTEGLEIDIFDIDYDDKGNRDDLVASGVVVLCKRTLYEHVKWCCKIDRNWIRHISDLPNASI